MRTNLVEPTHRSISIIALIQTGVIVFGCLWVSTFMKAYGYGLQVVDRMQFPKYFRLDAIFVRHFGFVLLLLPVMWVVLAIAVDRLIHLRWASKAMMALGIAAAILGACYFLALGFRSGQGYL